MAVAAGCAAASGRSPPVQGVIVPVTKVSDGDTLHVTYQGRDERVRLIGVDTPEVSWYGGKAECFGEEAGLYTRSRLDGRTVRLEFDVDGRDRYDRLLAYVFVGDELFNLTLVRLGYAAADPVPPDTARAAAFGDAEREARVAGLGQWSACPSSTP
jgi:micrococcal nuclease